MTMEQHGGQQRQFMALNGFRGVGALIVVLFHANLVLETHLAALPFLRHSYMMLDFFFVLSGFVIAHSYGSRLAGGYPVGRFVFRRLMRVYPVHALVIGLFVIMEMLKFVLPLGTQGPFESDYKSFPALISNLLLLHGMGVGGVGTWNIPSWSVSVEFFTYIAFAASVYVLRGRVWMACVAAIVLIPLWLGFAGNMNLDLVADGAYLRSLYGFSAGCLAYRIYSDSAAKPAGWQRWIGQTEFPVLCLIIAFMVFVGDTRFALMSPYVLMVGCVIIAFENGAVSRVMKRKIFMVFALLSYSIYMLHYFVISQLNSVARIYERTTGQSVIRHDADGFEIIDLGRWAGDAVLVVVLAAIVVGAALICKFVELPAYHWSKTVTLRRRQRESIPLEQEKMVDEAVS